MPSRIRRTLHISRTSAAARVPLSRRYRRLRASSVVAVVALAGSVFGSAAWATPDWNLGNTEISQISNINAQATGPIQNTGLGMCLDDKGGSTASGTPADSATCSGGTSQNWTFNPVDDYYWDLGFYGSITPANSAGTCLDITSTNGGAGASIADGGSVQMLLTTSGEVYAKSSVAMGGWTKESDFEVQEIAAGSDGTQMMVGADGSVYARSSIGGTAWTQEGAGSGVKAISANDGVQLYLGGDGTVYARNSIGTAASGWTAETGAGSKSVSVGSDGTQMIIGTDGAVYARSGIAAASGTNGLGGWTLEYPAASAAKTITTDGGVQMLVGSDNNVYAKTAIGNGGWTKEGGPVTDPAFSTPIAAGSDGTQVIVETDHYPYARKGVGTGFTKEAATVDDTDFYTPIAVGAGGLQTTILSSGVASAHVGIAATGWTTESDLTTDTGKGQPIQLTPCLGWKSQQWLFQHSKTGSLQLFNPASGRCVDTPSSSTTSGTSLQLYDCNSSRAQQFNPPAAVTPPTGAITDAPMNKCAIPAATTTTPATGTAVVLSTCGAGYKGTGPVLPWTTAPDGTLMSAGLCLSIVGAQAGTANGTLVQLASCAGTLDQQWVVGYDTSNRVRLVNPNSGRCLNDPSSNTADGTQLSIWDCNNTNAQVWNIPHAGHTFVAPVTANNGTVPSGDPSDLNARIAAMNTAANVRDTTAHLGLLLHAGGTAVRTEAAQALAGPDTALTTLWSNWEQSSWVEDPNGPLQQDVNAAAAADQSRQQRVDGIQHFLDGYPMYDYGSQPDFDESVTTFMSKDSTYWLAANALYQDLPVPKADQAAQDKVNAIAAAHEAADPTNASEWQVYAEDTIDFGSADDARRFIQYDGWPTVAPTPGTPEFRNEVEALKARWAGGDPSNPLDPDHVLVGAEETAWSEWQAELNGQAQQRANIVADEMQALDELKAGAETMHDGLDYAWTAGGILWAQGQQANNVFGWSSVDMSHASHDLGLIKAKVAGLAAAAQNEAQIAQDAANKASAEVATADATAQAAGLPEGRGLTYALQSAQVTKAAAAAAQATSNAMQTAVSATNATLADSATLLANAQAQADAARALYQRETAQDQAAQAAQLATQAQSQATAAANAAQQVAADKSQIATVEANAKAAQATADAAAADAAKQAQTAAAEEATANTQRANAAAADAAAQQQAATAASKQSDAANAATTAANDDAAAQQAVTDAAAAESKAQTARDTMNAAMAKADAAEAAAAAAAGTSSAADADAAAAQARSDANDAAAASDQANTDANNAENAAAAARSAATIADGAAAKANSDASTANAQAQQTHADAAKADSLAADAIGNAQTAATQAAASRASAQAAQQNADNAKAAADSAQQDANAAEAASAVATGQATATAQAAQAAAAEAQTVIAPANSAIDLSAPYAATDSAAGLASLNSEAAKSMAQQQADAAAAEAAQAATLAASAQAAANAASGDAKVAAQAAAAAATSAAQAAASAQAATASAAQAESDAQAVQASQARIHTMDAQATQDATAAQSSADSASSSAAAADAAATSSETDAGAARSAANDAQDSATDANIDAADAQASATDADQAASTAQADALTAQQAADAVSQLQQTNPQPGQITDSGASGVADVLTTQVITAYSFTPTSDCVGSGGCDITGNFHIEGYNVFVMVSCVTPSANDPETCIDTGSGPQVNMDVLGVVPLQIPDHSVTVHITQQQMLTASIKALPGELFGEYIGCAKLLTNNGGSLGDCGWVVAELAAPAAMKIVANGVRDLRLAMAAGDVTGIDSALSVLKDSVINSATLMKLEAAGRIAQIRQYLVSAGICSAAPHSFAAGTGVVMAGGRVEPIQDVRVGDEVENALPGGGVQVHRVDQTHVTRTDTDFTDLTVDAAGARSTITGTQNHPYYDVTRHAFVDASALAVGDRLQSTGSAIVSVAKVRNYTSSMVTYDLTIDDVHTYFVAAGSTPVLVHNSMATCSDAAFQTVLHNQQELVDGNMNHLVPGMDSRTLDGQDRLAAYLEGIYSIPGTKTLDGAGQAWYDTTITDANGNGLYIYRSDSTTVPSGSVFFAPKSYFKSKTGVDLG